MPQHIAYQQQKKVTGSPKNLAAIEIPEIEDVIVNITGKEDSSTNSSEREEGEERYQKFLLMTDFWRICYTCVM